MNRLKHFRWLIALALTLGSAQASDTLVIRGVFKMDEIEGVVGADLTQLFAHDNENEWSLTLYGVTYSHDRYYGEWTDGWTYQYHDQYVTHVHATSFKFEFIGPDAQVLNAVVSQQLSEGGFEDGIFLELRNHYDYIAWHDGGYDEWWHATWGLRLDPFDAASGVSFSAGHSNLFLNFTSDSGGFPVVESQRVVAERTEITDSRPGDGGTLASYGDTVDIDNLAAPLPPTLSITDGAAREGNKGTSRLDLTVTLSRSASSVVTVNYQTVNGAARAPADYAASSGKLTFQPGQTSRTISIAVKGDRNREANEAFSVQLSSAVGATINDAIATATILNDD